MKTNSVSNPNNSQPIHVPMRNGVRGHRLGHLQRTDVQQQDTFERTQTVKKYNSYNSLGATNSKPVAPQATAQPSVTQTEVQSNTPDITANYSWVDPRIQEMKDLLDEIYGRRAQESLRTSDARQHAWQRYFDPTARHFVGHDLNDWERQRAFDMELSAISYFERGRTGTMVGGWLSDPILEGRGLGNNDTNIPRIEHPHSEREAATLRFRARNSVASQLNALLSSNGVFVPENLKLRFIIDPNYNLRVEGTDDKDLIKQIEELLNRNGNARELFLHITQSRQLDSKQFTEDSFRVWQLGNFIEEFAGLNLRRDLELVGGRFVTEDGTDVLTMMWDEGVNPHAIALILDELYWLKNMGGAGNIPELTLSIDFMNGHLFDVGQENGFGPGQTDWIDRLPGTDALGARDYA